jgi:hypothetical protein
MGKKGRDPDKSRGGNGWLLREGRLVGKKVVVIHDG